MKKIGKLLVIGLFFQINSFSCALCKIDIPNVHIKTIITPQKENTKVEINWSFDEKFVSSLQQYDTNKNTIFDNDEQQLIKKDLIEYLVRFNYLTQIAYLQKEYKITEKELQKIQNVETSLLFQNGAMSFQYIFTLPIIPKDGYKLVINFSDLGNNFNFIVRDVIVKNYNGKKSLKVNASKTEILFDEYIPSKNDVNIMVVKAKAPTPLEQLSLQLQTYKVTMEGLIEDIKKTNSLLSYSWLLFFSFLYGVLHAIGPGHGKSLVGAYFLSENHSTKKAFTISMLIGVVHTFSAFLLTLTIYFVLNMLFANIFSDIEKVATKVSGGVIVLIALYLLYKKYTYKKKMTFSVHQPIPQVHQNHSSCGCGACSTNSTDLGVILSAGIVPCAGTVSVFLFTMGLGVYFVGFLSAIFMSLGMSFVIFITAYLSQNIRNKGASNGKLLKIFEYGSLVFILFLGMMLIY